MCLIDVETGKIVTAKRPARWRGALQLSAQIIDGQVTIRFPDGQEIRADDDRANQLMSTALGRQVRLSSLPGPDQVIERANPESVFVKGSDEDVELTTAPPGRDTGTTTFHDFGAVHLIATTSVERLSAHLARDPLEVIRFRPNLVVATSTDVIVENAWPGGRLHIGSAVFDITFPTPRCAVPMQRHGQLAERRDVLRAISQHEKSPMRTLGALSCLGVYARVAVPGSVAPGDDVFLED
jgi:uncharacterized protein YcbX